MLLLPRLSPSVYNTVEKLNYANPKTTKKKKGQPGTPGTIVYNYCNGDKACMAVPSELFLKAKGESHQASSGWWF